MAKDAYVIELPASVDVRIDSEYEKEIFREGLKLLLQKMSGSVDFESNSYISNAFLEPKIFVEQFSISKSPNKKTWIKFDKVSVDSLVSISSLPKWSYSPTILFCMNGMDEEVRSKAVDLAKTLGLQVIEPIYDLDEVIALNESYSSGNFEKFLDVTKKYKSDVVVICNLFEMPGNYRTSWNIFIEDDANKSNIFWETQDAEAYAALSLGLKRFGGLLQSNQPSYAKTKSLSRQFKAFIIEDFHTDIYDLLANLSQNDSFKNIEILEPINNNGIVISFVSDKSREEVIGALHSSLNSTPFKLIE